MKNEVLLSICITSYNRGSMLKENLERMLSYKGDEIEFVVSDNCSTDNTMELLKTIQDERVRIYRNDENLGFYKNAISVAMKASGKYLLRMNERDYANPRVLQKIVNWIKEENADFYVVDHDYLKEVREKPKGKRLSYEEKVYWLKKTRHPGEIIYRTTMYQHFWKNKNYYQMDDRKLTYRFIKLNFMFAEKGVGVHKTNNRFIVQPNVIKKKTLGQMRKEALVDEPYFLPKVELKNHIATQLVIKKCVPKHLQNIAVRECYRISLGCATFEFKDCINNPFVCQRYGYAPPKRVYWWLVHLKYLILTITSLKKRNMFSCNLCGGMLCITAKNYYRFVKKYNEY